jgi:hypothetical protein
MERTAEEFVHQVEGSDRWFIGDFQAADTFMATSGRLLKMADIKDGAVVTYAHKSSAKKAAQRWLEKTLDEIAAEEKAGPGCQCHGFGVYIVFNESTSSPAYEVRHCSEHPLVAPPDDDPYADEDHVQQIDAAGARFDACLQALADVLSILDLKRPDTATVDALKIRLAFLRNKED